MTQIISTNIQLIEKKFSKPIGGSGVTGVDIIVATLRDADGVAGLGFSYVIGGGGGVIAQLAQEQAGRFLQGSPLQAPPEHWKQIKKSFNRTGDGPNLLALAALDVALWDLTAQRRGEPLVRTLGGDILPVPVYASGGFSPKAMPQEIAELAVKYVDEGYAGVKPRLNANSDDEAVLRAVRNAIGPHARLMADANEKGNIETATRLLAQAAAYGLSFIEEPLPSDDILGYRRLAAQSGGVAIATGEHFQGLDRFVVCVEDGIAGVIQPDLAMAGGLTPCLEVARIAAAKGVTVAPHFLPGLFVHLSGAFNGQLLLEEFPIIEDVFEGWPKRGGDGMLRPRDCAGHGLELNAL
jgi:L-alanine-DL-glutamate epimerase-like enolase superfamily enzyme